MTAAAIIERPRSRKAGDGAEALHRIDTHEAVCAQRWEMILARIARLEAIVIGAAGTLILGMGGVIVTLMTKGLH
jgi:hypothetical protein